MKLIKGVCTPTHSISIYFKPTFCKHTLVLYRYIKFYMAWFSLSDCYRYIVQFFQTNFINSSNGIINCHHILLEVNNKEVQVCIFIPFGNRERPFQNTNKNILRHHRSFQSIWKCPNINQGWKLTWITHDCTCKSKSAIVLFDFGRKLEVKSAELQGAGPDIFQT